MYTYYNIHTHTTAVHAGTLSIVNLHEHFATASTHAACSVGLHPWYLQNAAQDWAVLEAAAQLPNVLTIGECGLDKVCDTDWQLQLNVFARQIELANKLKKPLIIHCVRAYEEVVALLHKQHVSVPVVFHGYNKKAAIAEKLVQQGYYLSFGAAILNDGSPAAEVLGQIPANQFLLETDDSQSSIKDIYKRAAEIRKTTEDAIILQVQDTFNKLTKR